MTHYRQLYKTLKNNDLQLYFSKILSSSGFIRTRESNPQPFSIHAGFKRHVGGMLSFRWSGWLGGPADFVHDNSPIKPTITPSKVTTTQMPVKIKMFSIAPPLCCRYSTPIARQLSIVTGQAPPQRYPVGMHIPRLNTELAAHVDQALILARQQDVHAAAHFLEAHRVPFPLICRVLMEPAHRRTPVDLTPPSS